MDDNHFEFRPSCGVVDPDLHTFWLCPENRNIKHAAVTSTDKSTRLACDESVDYPCLRLRGTCPKYLADIPEAFAPTSDYIRKYIAYTCLLPMLGLIPVFIMGMLQEADFPHMGLSFAVALGWSKQGVIVTTTSIGNVEPN